MPVNEIGAPYYIKFRLNTGVARHTHRLYMAMGTSIASVLIDGVQHTNLLFVGSESPKTVTAVVREYLNRFRTVTRPQTVLESIELWQSAVGANNFLGFEPLPTTMPVFTGANNAASYYTFVFSDAARRKARFTMFDGVASSPQRYPLAFPSAADDGTLSWYILRSQIPFATNDGYPLSIPISENIGYNRNLARRYGRLIAP